MMVLFDLSLTIWYNANCDKIVSKANIIKRIIFSEDSASAQNGQIRKGLNETKLGIEKIRWLHKQYYAPFLTITQYSNHNKMHTPVVVCKIDLEKCKLRKLWKYFKINSACIEQIAKLVKVLTFFTNFAILHMQSISTGHH